MPVFLVIKTLSFLLFVVLLIYGCFFWVKRRLKNAPNKPNNRITVIERTYVGDKLTVSLIKIDHQHFVLATGLQGVALMKLDQRDKQT